MENWRRFLLVEAELQYSKSAAQEVENLVKHFHEATSEKEKVVFFEIPTKEVYYSTNPKVEDGAAMYSFTKQKPDWDFDNLTDSQMAELKAHWDSSSRSFTPQFKEQYLKYPIHMQLIIDNEDHRTPPVTPLGSSGVGKTPKGKMAFAVSINPRNMTSDDASTLQDHIADVVRHELQHVTQKLNGLAVNYGEQLAKANGDFSKIRYLNSYDDIKKFGVGQELTGFRQAQGMERASLSQAEYFKRYLGDDFEYETWMSDMISRFIRFAIKQEMISLQDIEGAKYKSFFDPNNMTTQSRKMLAQTANATGIPAQQLFRNFQSQKTFDELSTGLVRKLIKGMDVSHPTPKDDEGNQMWKAGEVLNAFGDATGRKGNLIAFQMLSKLRRKEFIGDFLDNLTKRLNSESDAITSKAKFEQWRREQATK